MEDDEHAALFQVAKKERRNMRQQAALIIRQRLEQLGLLPAPNPPAPALEVKPLPPELPLLPVVTGGGGGGNLPVATPLKLPFKIKIKDSRNRAVATPALSPTEGKP